MRHTPEQIRQKLHEAEGEMASGSTLEQVCARLGISKATYHRWRGLRDGKPAEENGRAAALEKENVRLRKIVVELTLVVGILKEIIEGEF